MNESSGEGGEEGGRGAGARRSFFPFLMSVELPTKLSINLSGITTYVSEKEEGGE